MPGLDDLLGRREAEHYRRFFGGGGAPGRPDGQFYVLPARQSPGWQGTVIPPTMEETAGDEPLITRAGPGADACSSCTDLEPYPAWCYDVCGYYARLGVSWKAGRTELKRAYLERGGPGDPMMTYALKQLLSPRIRAAYDRHKPGTPFLPDKYVQEELKAQAAREASKYNAQGLVTTMDEILRRMGLTFAQPGEEIRSPEPDPEPEPAPQPRGYSGDSWFAHWTWYETGFPETGCEDHLPRWQELLCRAFAQARLRIRFAVGLHDGHDPLIRPAMSGMPVIVFLGRRPPTAQMAAEAAAAYLATTPS